MYKVECSFISKDSNKHTSVAFYEYLTDCYIFISEFPKDGLAYTITEVRDYAVVDSSKSNRQIFTNVVLFTNERQEKEIINHLGHNEVWNYLSAHVDPNELYEIRIRFIK